jgi:hypothetical protein
MERLRKGERLVEIGRLIGYILRRLVSILFLCFLKPFLSLIAHLSKVFESAPSENFYAVGIASH